MNQKPFSLSMHRGCTEAQAKAGSLSCWERRVKKRCDGANWAFLFRESEKFRTTALGLDKFYKKARFPER